MKFQAIELMDQEQILSEIQQIFLNISNDMNERFKEVYDAINGVKEEIVKVVNDKFDSFKDLVFKEFVDIRSTIKNSLYLILRFITFLYAINISLSDKSISKLLPSIYPTINDRKEI